MNFDDLQKSWKDQPLNVPDDDGAAREQLMQKWNKQQRTVLWSNIATTGGFAAVLCVLGWIYASFHEGRSILFGGSIATMTLLLLVFLWVLWKGTVLKKMDLSLPGNEYLARYTAALRWRRRTITHYTWVYMILLWLALMLYMLDVLAEASLAVRIGGPLATTAYLIVVKLATRKKQRKNLREIDELLNDLSEGEGSGL